MQTGPKAAKAAGDTYYFTGKPCVRGHLCNRFTSTKACVECLDMHKTAYRAKPVNRAKERKTRKKYLQDNAERLREGRLSRYRADPTRWIVASRKWKEANAERVSAYASKYKKDRPHANCAAAARYTASKLRATPPWADYEAIKLVYLQAAELTKTTGVRHEVDHIHPLRGETSCGLHVHYNLRAIPAKINRQKYNKLLEVD